MNYMTLKETSTKCGIFPRMIYSLAHSWCGKNGNCLAYFKGYEKAGR